MLRELRIRNLAILPEISITFSEGFNVLTGETGAGKSILMDALGLLAGERASGEDVRAGEDMANVEGVLEVAENSPLGAYLRESDVPLSGEEVVIRRAIGSDGRSRAFVNGTQWTISGLQQLAPYWIDISSQHGQQRLLDESFHTSVLDQFSTEDDLLQKYRGHYSAAIEIDQRLAKLRREREENLRQREFFEFQLRELTEAQLRPGEQEELQAVHGRLAHGEKLARAMAGVEQLIDQEEGLLAQLGKAIQSFRESVKLDSTLAPWLEELTAIEGQLRDLGAGVSRYGRQLEFEPEEIERINERLALMQRIVRKYGSMEAAISERDRAAERLRTVDQFAEVEKELESGREAELKKLAASASSLSVSRKKGAKEFSAAVTAELRRLGMPSAEFRALLTPAESAESHLVDHGRVFGPDGAETVRFELAPNPGEGFRPLVKIASGGELSRVLLAIKGIALRDASATELTYVFDEVDTGIGGETAERVGIRLHGLAQGRQVLCVTHLAQLACYADAHHRVDKKTERGRTVGRIELLPSSGRSEELARMIGGIEITPKTREYAGELLRRGSPQRVARPLPR